ncbi:MAG: hypothetical protein ASARMPREDX12_008924 [Alectoria sarmentosa]|nr:MAG: hypothetical protein ASARMPREDX12_008924 [Alectoria sarmentosa]
MSPITTIIAEVAAAADKDGQGDDPKAHALLLNSIQRLQLAAEKPPETANRILYQPPTNAALRIAVELGLIDAVAARKDDPITAHQLAIQQSTEELLVIRVMRAITAMGLCNEPGPGLYSPNQVTRELATVGLRGGVKYDSFMPAAANVVKCLHQNEIRSPREAKETPFFSANNATFFEWLKENPQQRNSFDSYMGINRKENLAWCEVFPITDQFSASLRADPRAVLLVDVGGSHGHDLLKFKERCPDLPGRLILQDLPEKINSLSGELSGIEKMAYNFYDHQPVKGARVYFFGAICHDWPDDDCVKFLSNTATAMERDYSTLLIRDLVVPETGASVRTAAKDIQMMSLFAGMERTESQWINLLSLCGLSLVRIWYSGNGAESVIEATIKH